ncbi:poly [ADP-ribose] polymerase 12, partial [Biomphalaria glabrata]
SKTMSTYNDLNTLNDYTTHTVREHILTDELQAHVNIRTTTATEYDFHNTG